MLAYFARRLAFALFLVFAVSSAALVLARLAPGDFATQSVGFDGRTGTMEEARARYGLNRSIGEQYGVWIAHAMRLDFGQSLLFDRPVADLIPERAANTAILAFTALLFATLVGLPLGVVSGSRPAGILTSAIRGVSLVMLSMPPLLTSLFLVFAAARTGWLPVGGMTSTTSTSAGDLLRHLVVPAAALALPLAALFERLQSQAMSDVISQPYMLATRARGIPLSRAIWRDALKGALGPVSSVYGLVDRHAPERLVRGGDDHGLAGAGPADARRAPGARRVPRRRLRRRGLGVPRHRHAAVRHRARAGGSTAERQFRV